MSKLARVMSVLGTAALGVGVAVAVGAGDDGVAACAHKRSGEILVQRPGGKCAGGSIAITISGNAFKRGRRGGTLTINGVPFRTGTLPNSLTINGNSFRTGTLPNTLTINGVSFKKGAGNTLTINGTPFTGATAGPTGPAGPVGPPGPAGSLSVTPPAEQSGPSNVTSGNTATVVTHTLTITDGVAHRILVAGGVNALCNPCSAPTTGTLTIARDGTNVITRRLTTIGDGDATSGAVSEILTTPATCGPCTYALTLTLSSSAAASSTVTYTDGRLGIVDLGPAS